MGTIFRAHSSVVERFIDIEEVEGSIPSGRTRFKNYPELDEVEIFQSCPREAK